jgi:hypothetical protein
MHHEFVIVPMRCSFRIVAQRLIVVHRIVREKGDPLALRTYGNGATFHSVLTDAAYDLHK